MKIEKNRNCVSCPGGEHGFEKQFFDANSYQVPGGTIILQLARHWLLFFENHKIDRAVVLGRPGGMRGGAGRRYEEGLRYTKDFGFGFDTPALLYETGGGFNRSAHSAGPSTRDDSHGKWEQGTGKKDCMGSENRELGRRVAWEVGTGRWEEGLH